MMRGLALAGAMLAAACATPAPIAGSRWVAAADVPDRSQAPAIEFVNESRVAGFTGCNLMSGEWHMEAGQLRLGRLVTTKRACIGPASETEKRVLDAIGEGGRISIEGDRLVATAPGGARFEFMRQ